MLGRLFQRPCRGDLEDFTQVSPRKQLGLRAPETAPVFARMDSTKTPVPAPAAAPLCGESPGALPAQNRMPADGRGRGTPGCPAPKSADRGPPIPLGAPRAVQPANRARHVVQAVGTQDGTPDSPQAWPATAHTVSVRLWPVSPNSSTRFWIPPMFEAWPSSTASCWDSNTAPETNQSQVTRVITLIGWY